MLSPQRLDRFARHIILPEIGGAGQIALTNAHVLLVGCGGIGSPALQYLAGAGIGRITIIDDDTIDASNLQRQTIFSPADIGKHKAIAAQTWAERFDSAIRVTPIVQRITADNVASIISGADVVLDGCDNFATRLIVSDACVAAGIPLTSAAVGRFQGQVANFAGHLPDHACYRCFVGDAFETDDCDTCAADGVLGAMVGMMGCFAVMHAIRIILAGKSQLGDPQWGKLHVFNGLAATMRTLNIIKDPQCKGCSHSAP